MSSAVRVLFLALLIVSAGSPSFAQLRPVGLQNKTIVALAAEQGDPDNRWFPFTANHLFAATPNGGIYHGRTWDNGKQWLPIGPFADPPFEVVAMTVQHWGVGPRDGLNLIASVRPRPSVKNSPVLLRRGVMMIGPSDSTWERADSGIVKGETPTTVYALDAYYYTGHRPPLPVLGWSESSPLRGSAGGNFWESSASQLGQAVSMDMTARWSGQDVWAAGSTEIGNGDAAVFHSDDAGVTWSYTAFSDVLPTMAYAVAVATGHPDTAFASIEGEVFRTTNGGSNWEFLLRPAAGKVIALACDPQNPSQVFAGTNGPDFRLYSSGDLGIRWELVLPDPNLRPAAITCMTIALIDTVPMGMPPRTGLFIGTNWTGVWLHELDSSPTGVVSPPSPVETTLHLYPNPARGTAMIEATLPAARAVQIDVFDVLGRRLRSVDMGIRSAGVHIFSLPVDGLVPGSYIVHSFGKTHLLRILE